MKPRKGVGMRLLAAAVVGTLIAPIVSAQIEDEVRSRMAVLNARIEATGANVRLVVVDFLTTGEMVGQTIYFNDRIKVMGSHFVPGDPWRGGEYHITWLSDQADGAANGLTLAETQAALERAMATWDGVVCRSIPLVQLDPSVYPADLGYTQFFWGSGGYPAWFADITHAGWLPRGYFDWLTPGGGNFILGATHTYAWVDDQTGQPTDMDNNGKLDVAFREVYYNNRFQWRINANYDVESLVLHETGHGLSLGHFGKLFKTDANGLFHFAPDAVMNAGYTGVKQDLFGTDISTFCGLWAYWGWPFIR
jgi:hypothetical protein